jgi:Recombinase
VSLPTDVHERIASERRAGRSLAAIADSLNAQQVPTAQGGRQWWPSTVRAVLDIFWLRDESLEDTDNLAAPEVIAAEIVEDLQAALDEFSAIASTLSATRVSS